MPLEAKALVEQAVPPSFSTQPRSRPYIPRRGERGQVIKGERFDWPGRARNSPFTVSLGGKQRACPLVLLRRRVERPQTTPMARDESGRARIYTCTPRREVLLLLFAVTGGGVLPFGSRSGPGDGTVTVS